MFGYKLVRKKDLEDLSRMQSYAIEALNSIEVTEKSNRRKVIFAKIKSENVSLKIDNIIRKAK